MAEDKYLKNRQIAYDLLKKEGYTDIGDSAEKLFENRSNGELAFKLLKEAGYEDLGDDYVALFYGDGDKSSATATKGAEEVQKEAERVSRDALAAEEAKTQRAERTRLATEGRAMFDEMRRERGVQTLGERVEAQNAVPAPRKSAQAPTSSVSEHLERQNEDVRRFGTGNEAYSADDAARYGKEYESIIAENEALGEEIERYKKTGQGNYTSLSERQRSLRQRTEELMSSPAGKEYKDLLDRYNTLKDVSDTPEIVKEKNRIATLLSRNPIARAMMGDEAPSESQIRFTENRAEAQDIEAQMETADRAKRKELKKRLKEVNKELLDNEYYQEDVAKRKHETQAQLDDVLSKMSAIEKRYLAQGKPESAVLDPDYRELNVAAQDYAKTLRQMGHIQDKNANNFWVNFADVFTDLNTYTFGMAGLDRVFATKTAVENPDEVGSQEVLSAVSEQNALQQEIGQFIDSKGRWGSIAGNSIPFAAQIALTGGGGNVANYVSQGVKSKLGRNLFTRVLGAGLGDIAAGFTMANTIGAGKTLTDILDRYYGTLVADGEGGYGYEGGTNLAEAIWKGEAGNTIEFASERAGEHLSRLIGKGILGKAINAAQKNGGKINPAVEELAKTMNVYLKDFNYRSSNQTSANWMQKAMGGFFKVSNMAGVQGYPFEVMEEYIGLVGNILVGGEEDWMDFSKLGDKETHADIWGGMLYSIGVSQGGAIALGTGGLAFSGIEKARLYHKLESALAADSASALELLGDEEWTRIKEEIDGTTNEELAKKVAEYMDNPAYDAKQREAVLDYVKNTYIFRGFNAGTLIQAKERLTGEPGLMSLDINAEAASAQDQVSDAYMLGYNLSTNGASEEELDEMDSRRRRTAVDANAQMDDIDAAVEKQRAYLEKLTGVSNMSEQDASVLLNDQSVDQKIRDAALDYLMGLAVERGFLDGEQNRKLQKMAQFQAKLEKQYGGAFYHENAFGDRDVETAFRNNPSTGQPEGIFITGDPNSAGEVPFISQDGKSRGFVRRDDVFDMDADGYVSPGMTNVVPLNDYLEEMYRSYESRREMEVEQEDEAITAVREATESAENNKNSRGIVEGMEDEDGALTYNGKRGRLIRKTDMGAVFEPEDGSDNVELTWEQLANGTEMPAAEEPAPEPAPAEVPEETYAEEPAEEAPKIPLDKDGNPIYDAPGVSVEDALADMYTTEGLDEADVDEYIINRAAEAEKGRAVKQGKMSLKEWGQKKKEANRVADFWGELAKFANENKAAREKEEKEEAARQELIKTYGVDTSNFDLTPQTAEEAVAEYLGRSEKLINLDDAIRETLGKRKDNRVPTELFRHLGAHGILTKDGGRSVADVARDIVGEYEGTMSISEDDVRDAIIDALTNKTKSEIRETIFNNRLEQAKGEADMSNEEPAPVEEPAPAPVVEESEPASEQEPEQEAEEEVPEDLPEETVEEETSEPETTVAEEPETTTEEAENKEENSGKSEDNSVTSQEGETKTEVAPESTYGSSNKVVSKDRYEELKKKMLAKIKGQANAGFDPEIFAMGVEMAAYHIEAGARKFVEFAKRMIADLTDAIRPYLKGIYNGARDLPGMEEYKKEMTPVAEVDAIDINADFNTLSDEQDNTDVQQGDGGVSGTETDSDEEGTGGESGAGDESADNGNAEEDNDSGGDEGGSGDVAGEGADESGGGPADEGADATAGGRRRGGRKANDGKSTRKGAGRRGGSRRGEAEGADGVGRDADVEEETEEQKEAKAAKTEQDAYEAEKERIKDNTDTNALKKLFDEIKEKLTGITDKFDETRAKLAGQLRAVRERLQDLFSKNVNKSEALAQEKVPYSPVSDPTGEHAIGSVVPSGSADYMRDAIKRLEKEVGKPVAEFVMEELGYSSLDEMFTTADKEKFTGLSSEQVDAVGLAIQQIKTGRIFIVGDMTGVGKGRVGAALIRWGHRHGKKVIFCTEQPNLFTAMYEDINDIGGLERVAESAEKSKGKGKNKAVDTAPVPFIINSASEANITDDEDNVIVRHSNEAQRSSLFTSGKDVLPPLPGAKNKGKTYDFVMTTYSQLQATEEEEEGTSDKVKKKNERNTKGRQRIQWLKRYAKDAVVIMDESHTAAGTESTRGQNALKLVDAAQGVMFMSATFAKTPEAMSLYAVRSSMNEAQISRDQLIRAISDYGIPMQEILSATLYKTGEYVRRERDFDGVKTNWCQPEEIYSASEIETARNLSDYTTGTINDIIDFQRRYVDPIIRRLNKAVSDANQRSREMFNAGITDSFTQISYASTSYAGQVSNVVGMMLFAIKAKKAADMAIEQIKRGEKPVIAVDNTLGAYVDEIEGDVESADFGTVLKKGLAFALKYQMTTKKFVAGKGAHGEELRNKPKEVKGDRVVEKFDSIEDQFGEAAEDAMRELSDKIVTYGKETLKLDLSLSPIDYIKKRIEDAGFKCGEITKRENALVQNEDGTWTKKPLKHNKKEVIRRFNGGKAGNPLPKEETYDAVIMNRSGATGNSMHASRKFGDQRPRKMIILQAAKDPNNEVQIRGRIDRTGQVHRGEYFYIISPIPAEKKLTMMLRQKLASLDAQSVGTEKVSSNKVEAEDMDNKYGDEVAKEFLAEHQEINLQLDRPIVQVFNRKTREMEWKGRPGLLYDLMKGMQRMTCMEQEMILQELEEAYSQKIEYLNQNGINDLATTTMDLEATTIDKAIMVKGKNNEAMSEFAHDTTIERVEVNVLRKPLRSEDIVRKEKELGVFEKHEKTDSRGEKEEVSYGEYVQSRAQEAAQALREEKRRKQKEAEDKLAEDIRVEFPREDGESETDYEERIYNDNRMANLRSRNEQERVNYQRSLQEQLVKAKYATTYLKPGYVYLVPLNDTADAQTMYGRFMGFKTGKDGRPNSIEAVFATKDSRAQVSIPVVGMKGMIERIANTNNPSFGDLFGKTKYDYESEEARLKAYDVWWDKMIPEKTARSVRYMITGNILQSVGQLKQQRGMIVTFTRKDAETGEITIDKGLLLAEDFDPENFMVRTEITKEDVWNNAGEFRDTISHIAVFRDGDRLRVKFYRDRDSREDLSEHDVNDDDEFKALCEDGQIIAASRDELHAVIPEENAAEALRILYRNYGFTQGHLLILPDSTEKPDRIVPSGKNYDAVINELQPKYHCWSASSCQSEINKLLKTYKMDINNEDVKRKISELVQLRQAYLRKSYCRLDSQDLAWHIVIYEQEIALLERPRPNESPEEAKRRKDERQEKLNIMEAFREELQFREPTKGHMKHFKQGKIELSEIIKTFKEFNKNKENARIAEKVFAVMKKLNVNIFMDENATDDPRKRRAGGRTAGDYLMYNWRFMNEDTIPDQLKADTILHEMCHTMTAYVLEAIDNGATSLIPGLVDAGKQADALYWAIHNNKAFKHNAGEGPTSGTYPDYGTTDTYEMLAETGASAQFRGDLAQVKVAYKEETTTSFGKTRTSFEFTDVTEQENPQGDVMTALEAASDILERMIAGFNEDGYKKVWTGTGYGQMGYRVPTELNRSAVTPEQDAEYMDAVNSGDMEKAGRMVRDAFKAAFPNTKAVDENGEPAVVYHGSPSEGFTVFDKTKSSNKRGYTGDNSHYFTSSNLVGETYGTTRAFFLNMEDPYEADFEGRNWKNQDWSGIDVVYSRDFSVLGEFDTVEEAEAFREKFIKEHPEYEADYVNVRTGSYRGDKGKTTDEQIKDARNSGKDGAIFHNIVDYGDFTSEELLKPSTDYVVFNSNQIKSADPVTRDDNGNVIPLSERFNVVEEDIRYRHAENLNNPIDRAAAITKINDISKKLGITFKEDRSLKAKGEFNAKTNEIRINIDAHKNTADIEATLLHEAVAHYGLRKLFGDEWKALRQQLYKQAAPEIKARVDAIAKKYGLSSEVALEEYLAQIAEDGWFDRKEETFWQKVINAIKRMFSKIGIDAGYLTEADLSSMLFASYRNLQTGGALETAARVATAAALRRAAEASHEEEDNGPEDDGPGGTPTSDRTTSAEFKEFFGDWQNDPANASKVVDENGSPKLVAHGSRTAAEFSVFDYDADTEKARGSGKTPAFFFTDMDKANVYARNGLSRGRVIPAYLSIKKPVEIDYEGARYDGVGIIAKVWDRKKREWVPITNNKDGKNLKYFATERDAVNEYARLNPGASYVRVGEDILLTREYDAKPAIGEFVDGIDRNVNDGAIVKNIYEVNDTIDDYVVFSSNQIKSPDAKAFNTEDPDIYQRELSDLPDDIRKDVEDLETDQETEVLYRRASNSATAQTAAEMYGDKVRTIGSAVKEVLVDEMAPVDTLMDALATESGTKIKDDERVSDMIRETGGKAMQAVREYDKKFLQPMWSAVGEFRKNTGTSIKDTETYIGLKSGLERNVVLAKRDTKRDYQAEYDAEIDEINQEEKTKKKALDKQLKNGKISDVTYAGELTLLQQEMQQKRDDAELRRKGHFADVDAGTDERFLEYRKKDYSAITAWAETEDLQEAERLAGDYVNDMESRAGNEATKELWKRINAATKETLKFQYDHQILSRQQYQDISKMMEYYVPMRGFSDDTAEDLFNYYVTPQSNDFQATVLTAKGRKTWYEGPLGNIGAMHSSAISQGVKNDAKLALLDAVRRRPKNTIATVTRAWFVKNGQKDANGKDQYDVAYPQIPEGATLAQRESIIEQFEQDMAQKKAAGDAYNSHREVDLHGGVVAFERQAHMNEHIVKVREGGKEYGIIINGNPAAAQAINGVRRGNGAGEKFLGYLRSFTRVLSSMFTTFSVPFWVSNFQRDHGQGLTNAFIRNNPEYVGRYIANRIKAAKLFPLILGSETMDKALAKGDPVAKLYKQYLDNGGPMGQNRIQDNEYFERQMKRYLSNSAKQGIIKGATAVLNIIGGVGEAIETITRFAVFMTSMESGRPIHESISDAKEISTNFARKGSGRSFSRDEIDRMTHADGTKLKPIEKSFVSALSVGVELCRASIPFFNAAVQGLENKVTNYREHFWKTLLADSIYLILGFGMQMLLGNAGGDDDKEKYSHTSDYLRRNNILNPMFGDGVYAKWALPQEYRVMYALGDILGSAIKGERPAEDLGMDVFGAIMQLSPIGAVTDEVAFSAENKKKAYETLFTNAMPGVIAPVLESIFNMDFKGARIYNEGFNENLHAYPGWTKALPTTGSEYVAVAEWLNEATGGNDVERGWVNINPAIVEHLVESYFSGPYQIVVRLPEAAVKIAKGEATVRDIPLLNRIILNTNDNQRDAYYNNMYYYFKEKNTEAERIHSEYKGRPKEGKVAEFYQSDNYKYMLIFNKYDKIERELRKASKLMAEKGDDARKKEYDDWLQDIQYRIAKECLDIYFGRNKKEEVK